jgi:hypothetical protein
MRLRVQQVHQLILSTLDDERGQIKIHMRTANTGTRRHGDSPQFFVDPVLIGFGKQIYTYKDIFDSLCFDKYFRFIVLCSLHLKKAS